MEDGLRSHDEDEDIQGGQINQISSGKETTYLLILDCLPHTQKWHNLILSRDHPNLGLLGWPKNGTDAFVSCWIAAGTTSLPAPHEVQSSPNQLTISTIRMRENHQKVGHSLNTWPARSAEGYPDRITIPFWVPIEEVLHHWSMSLLYNCIYGTVHSCHELHANQRITIWDTQWISMVSTSVYQIQWVVRFCSVFKMFYLFSSRRSRSAMFGTYAQGTWTWYLFSNICVCTLNTYDGFILCKLYTAFEIL